MCEMYEIGAKIEYQQVKRHSDSISFAVIVPADQGLNTPSGLISTNDEPQVSHSLLSAWILAFVVCSALIGGCTLGIVVDTKRRKMSMKRKASEFLLHFVNSADA